MIGSTKIAADFVEHCATRWASGKSMLVCIDKITCARMYQRIMPRWQAKLAAVRTAALAEPDVVKRDTLNAQAQWLEETIIEIIISEAQNEVADFRKWDFDIIPHRTRIEAGVRDRGQAAWMWTRRSRYPEHPFRGGHNLRDVADRFRRRVPFHPLRR